jgi:aminoglycoside phosphotransferase (APT) family kinase protein
MQTHVAAFVARRWSVPADRLRVTIERVDGGLESAVSIARLAGLARFPAVPRRLIVKELSRGFQREAAVYAWLWGQFTPPPAVRSFGIVTQEASTLLFLEHAGMVSRWPWRETRSAADVCRELARLHDNAARLPESFCWNYEEELLASARLTLRLAETVRTPGGERCWQRMGDLRRIVEALPQVRARLLAEGTTLIHGDVHPGNVFVRESDADRRVVLIDWARARAGSPLEDIASWLHSLGCWEPQARRRHDTLMRTYLGARRERADFDETLRQQYWLASASNGLAGAIRYHLSVLGDAGADERRRRDGWRAARAWQRVVRRAAGVLNTSRTR